MRQRALGGAQPWLVWALGVLAYIVAVFNRSSLGVAGLAAVHRFGVGAGVLSLFAVVQLVVYAGMQVPVGVALDRFGSRRLLVTGGLLMATGQLALAVAHTVTAALLARVLVGGGDAMTFLSVLRLVPAWFPARRVPLVTQLTGLLGQLGQLAAAYPLATALRGAGWTASYTGAATTGLLVTVLVAVALRDAPVPSAAAPALPVRQAAELAGHELRLAWRQAGTRLGLWTHFTTQFSATVFSLLWGYPFIVAGERRSPALAAGLLSLIVVVSILVGPLFGHLVQRWPYRRSALTFSVVAATATSWAVVLGWPGRVPVAMLVVLAVVLGTNGPASLVGFDYARTDNPAARLGSATGIVNVGGFVASVGAILGIGALISLAGRPDLTAFRVALAVQFLLWGGGLQRVVHHRRILRRHILTPGAELDPLPRALLRRWRERQDVAVPVR